MYVISSPIGQGSGEIFLRESDVPGDSATSQSVIAKGNGASKGMWQTDKSHEC